MLRNYRIKNIDILKHRYIIGPWCKEAIDFINFIGKKPTYRGIRHLTNNLPRKSTNSQICFLKQVVFCAKKAVDDRQKDQLKILKRVNKELLQRLTQETNLGTVQFILKKDLHFFLYRVSVVHEITP
jgi:hypothetical protein